MSVSGVERALSAETVRAWLLDSCRRQGVPVTITDPGVVATIASLLGGEQARGQPHERIVSDRSGPASMAATTPIASDAGSRGRDLSPALAAVRLKA